MRPRARTAARASSARGRTSLATAWIAAAVAVLLAFPGAAAAADLKIGYIDSSRIFQEYNDAKEAQARFDRMVQGWRDEAAEKEKQVKQLRDEVRDQSPILSALKRQEKEETLQRAISDYEKFIQDIWGPNGKAAAENERATGEVVAQIRAEVEKLANSRGLELVLDAAGGFIIYADHSMDLTSQVIQDLNSASRTGTQR
ncbi:MAG TPA: OmpH family outer membrane protein [Candidatus Eisenbacteria bacterium]